MLYLFDRKRIYRFIAVNILPITIYLMLRIHAVGIFSKDHSGPIDSLKLSGRLMTMPSIVHFYLTRFVLPVRLATSYFWTYPKFSMHHFLTPLCIDLSAVSILVYVAIRLHSKSNSFFRLYIFFVCWFLAGLLTLVQLVPLDMTASEPWFYFSMAGLLGMIGIVLKAFPLRLSSERLVLINHNCRDTWWPLRTERIGL
jgi:hypothetical protein